MRFCRTFWGSSGTYQKKICLLIIIITSILLFRLGSWGVIETSEARYAQISLAMSHSGDMLHPELLNIYHFHKPPITYLITSIAYTLFQPTAFWSRFFLQVALLVQLILVYRIGIILFNNPKMALHATVIYVSFPLVIISSRALTADAYLNTFCLLGIYLWMVYRKYKKKTYLYLFYLVVGLGFLTKGPLILVILPVIIAYNWCQPKSSTSKMHGAIALTFGILVSLSWYLLLLTEDDKFLHYFLYEHTYQRSLDPDHFNRAQPFWFYLVVVPVTSFPWFLVLIELLVRKRSKIFKHAKWTVLLMWILLPLLLFSLSSSKLTLYVLPIYPGIALAASWSVDYMGRLLKKWQLAQFYFQAIALLGLICLNFMTDLSISYQLIIFFLISLFGLIIVHFYWSGSPAEKLIWSGLVFILIITSSSSYIISANPSFRCIYNLISIPSPTSLLLNSSMLLFQVNT